MSVKLKKRGQFSAFFIVGILLLVMMGVFLYLIGEQQTNIIEAESYEAIENQVLPPLKTYVDRCVLKASQVPIRTIGLQGGTLDPSDFVEYYGNELNYLCLRESPETACRNTLLTIQRMEYELEQTITTNMKDCVDMDMFRLQGNVVEEGDIFINVTIGSHAIRVQAEYPINITENVDKITRVKDFLHIEQVPLGSLYYLAQAITFDEITKDDFDKDAWMIRNNAKTIIDKHRPYPDKVYVLEKEGYTFQFGIQGKPTIGMRKPEAEILNGCCINKHDGTCFANVPETLCAEINGDYTPSESCSCPAAFSFDQSIELSACESTYDPETNEFNGPRKRHGESWCNYESIVGKGYDYVGSRHFLHTCIDGKELIEECRDFREELCTEDMDSSNAKCRVNRWYDCASCDTETCCEDTNYRDCYWNDWLETPETKCTPQVSPGLKFWERQGSDVCFRANREKTCEDLSCPNNFIDSGAILCYKQGDCGNFRNTEDIATTEGFFETDIIDEVRPYVMLPPGFNRNYRDWTLTLPLDKTTEKPVVTDAETPAGNIPSMIQSAAKFIDDILQVEFSDFLKPFQGDPVIEVTDYTLCDLWTPPINNMRCDKCDKYDEWPCTEYKCKSLGEWCVFENKNGTPTCKEMKLDDDDPPIIEIDSTVLDERYSYEPDELADFKGYHLTPDVLPYKPLKLGIKTNEPTRCKIDYSPTFKFVEHKQGYYSLPSLWFGEPTFDTKHNIRFRTPPKIVIPQKILDFLNFSSTSDFSGAIDDLEGMYEGYQEEYKDTLELYETFSGDSITGKLNPMIDSIWDTITIIVPEIKIVTKAIIDQYTSGGYYIFVKCIDMAGNENDEQFYFKFEVDENLQDTDPPRIEVVDPEQDSEYREQADVKLYLDEPAECKFDYTDKAFSEMNESFDCVTSAYQISPVDGGTYECRKKIKSNESDLMLYIKCADNPIQIEKYKLHVHPDNMLKLNYTENITDYDPSVFASIYVGTLEASADFLNKLDIGIPASNKFNLDLYIDNYLECKYDINDAGYDDMQNNFSQPQISNDINKGQYIVSAELEVVPEEQNLSMGRYILNITKSNISSIGNKTTFNKSFDSVLDGYDAVEFNSTILDVKFNISTEAACRFSLTDKEYKDMNTMSCTVVDNTTTCNKGIVVDNNKTLYVECEKLSQEEWMPFDFVIKCAPGEDIVRNIMEESYIYLLKKGVPVEITSLYPAGGQMPEGIVELKVGVNKDIEKYEIECGYALDLASGFINMPIIDGGFSTSVDLTGGMYTFFFRCEDKYGSKDDKLSKFEVVI